MRGRNPPLLLTLKNIIMNTLKESLEKYQLHTTKTYMSYEQDKYNSYQNYLYKRAMYGLNSITQEELATMCSKKKQRIINVYKRAQSVLNIAKQKASINYTNFLFKTLFPNSPFTDILLSCTEVDEKFKNTLSFKDLGINKDQIVNLFIQEGILPKNFMDLVHNPSQLPRLRSK